MRSQTPSSIQSRALLVPRRSTSRLGEAMSVVLERTGRFFVWGLAQVGLGSGVDGDSAEGGAAVQQRPPHLTAADEKTDQAKRAAHVVDAFSSSSTGSPTTPTAVKQGIVGGASATRALQRCVIPYNPGHICYAERVLVILFLLSPFQTLLSDLSERLRGSQLSPENLSSVKFPILCEVLKLWQLLVSLGNGNHSLVVNFAEQLPCTFVLFRTKRHMQRVHDGLMDPTPVDGNGLAAEDVVTFFVFLLQSLQSECDSSWLLDPATLAENHHFEIVSKGRFGDLIALQTSERGILGAVLEDFFPQSMHRSLKWRTWSNDVSVRLPALVLNVPARVFHQHAAFTVTELLQGRKMTQIGDIFLVKLKRLSRVETAQLVWPPVADCNISITRQEESAGAESELNFHLGAVIFFVAGEGNGRAGHYTAVTFGPAPGHEAELFLNDDSLPVPFSKELVSASNAYVLVYQCVTRTT